MLLEKGSIKAKLKENQTLRFFTKLILLSLIRKFRVKLSAKPIFFAPNSTQLHHLHLYIPVAFLLSRFIQKENT